jgi:hypothetical protein
MARNEKKRFLLRMDGELFEALERWAANELRSVNGQIEYLLNDAVKRSGRGPSAKGGPHDAEKKA